MHSQQGCVGEPEHIVIGLQNVAYDYRGAVYCYCEESGERQEIALGLFNNRPQRFEVSLSIPALRYEVS